MSSDSRDVGEAIYLIDSILCKLSGGSTNQSALQQGVFNNTMSVGSARNLGGGDVINIDSTGTVKTDDIDIDHHLTRYQTISEFAEVGRLISEGVDKNENEIDGKLISLTKSSLAKSVGFIDDILSIGTALSL